MELDLQVFGDGFHQILCAEAVHDNKAMLWIPRPEENCQELATDSVAMHEQEHRNTRLKIERKASGTTRVWRKSTNCHILSSTFPLTG